MHQKNPNHDVRYILHTSKKYFLFSLVAKLAISFSSLYFQIVLHSENHGKHLFHAKLKVLAIFIDIYIFTSVDVFFRSYNIMRKAIELLIKTMLNTHSVVQCGPRLRLEPRQF